MPAGEDNLGSGGALSVGADGQNTRYSGLLVHRLFTATSSLPRLLLGHKVHHSGTSTRSPIYLFRFRDNAESAGRQPRIAAPPAAAVFRRLIPRESRHEFTPVFGAGCGKVHPLVSSLSTRSDSSNIRRAAAWSMPAIFQKNHPERGPAILPIAIRQSAGGFCSPRSQREITMEEHFSFFPKAS